MQKFYPISSLDSGVFHFVASSPRVGLIATEGLLRAVGSWGSCVTPSDHSFSDDFAPSNDFNDFMYVGIIYSFIYFII